MALPSSANHLKHLRFTHYVLRVLPALVVLLALLARLAPGPRTIDDAYITFRYARNLLAGYGAVFNPGEAVLGTTTPLYMGLLAGLGALTGGADAPFPLLAVLVNALADAGTALLLWQFGRRLGSNRAGIAAALLWAIAPYSVTFAIGGLETSLYVLLLTGCAYAAFSRRRNWAAALAAGALLTRPDALILLGPLALERLYSAIWRREPIRPAEWLLAGLPLLAWGIAASLTYGSPLPHSIAAKVAAYRLEPGAALIRLVQHYATPFLEYNLLPTPLAVGIGLLLYPFLALLGARWALRAPNPAGADPRVCPGAGARPDDPPSRRGGIETRPTDHPPAEHQNHGHSERSEESRASLVETYPEGTLRSRLAQAEHETISGAPGTLTGQPQQAEWRLLPFLLYPWLYAITFALPNPLIFRWYLTPPLPAYFLCILLGADALLQALARKLSARWSTPRRAIAIGAAALILLLWPLGFSLAEWTAAPDHGPRQPAPEMAWFKLELLYRQAAGILSPRLTPASLLAAGDVGVLGYFTPARILDTVGLNSPVSTTYYPLPVEQYEINYAIPAQLILDQSPDFIVILEVYGRRTLLADAEFQRRYRLLETLPTDIYGSQGMLIFERR